MHSQGRSVGAWCANIRSANIKRLYKPGSLFQRVCIKCMRVVLMRFIKLYMTTVADRASAKWVLLVPLPWHQTYIRTYMWTLGRMPGIQYLAHSMTSTVSFGSYDRSHVLWRGKIITGAIHRANMVDFEIQW